MLGKDEGEEGKGERKAGMSDVRVQVRFRNDMLQRLIDEHPLPMYKIAEEIDVSVCHLMGLKALQRSPWSIRSRENYSKSAIRIAANFNLPPEVLFPEEIYRIKWPSKLEKAFPAERIACLVQSDEQRRRALPPHEEMENKEKKELLDSMLKTLTPREEMVLRKRFGLGDEEFHTLEEVGQDFKVNRERIRQIEAKALRKLRNPGRFKIISPYLPERKVKRSVDKT